MSQQGQLIRMKRTGRDGEPVWAYRVGFVVGVCAQDSFEVTAPHDEDAIEAVVADRAHPALSERVRVRRLYRRSDHRDAFRAEDFVEGAAELSVAVVDQQSEVASFLAGLHDEVASLLRDPGAVWVGCGSDELESARREREEEEHVDPLQAERLDCEEIARERAGGLLAQE